MENTCQAHIDLLHALRPSLSAPEAYDSAMLSRRDEGGIVVQNILMTRGAIQ